MTDDAPLVSNSKMASPCEVLSFLRILTSTSSNTRSTEREKEFDEVLVSNMKRLWDALGEKGSFVQLQDRLESQLHVHVNENCSNFLENTEVCKKDSSEKDSDERESSLREADLTQHKDLVRWTYVETCLELLKLLKESLIKLKKESEGKKVELKPGKRGNEAPPLPVDSLGVGDQKTVLTAIQFVVILGICPNLFPGVGVPVERRSGFASLLNIHCNVKNERRLFECMDTLVECIAQSSLGSLVLSRHLGDILSGLLQISYAPVSAYSNYNKTNGSDSTDVSDICGAGVSNTLASHSSDKTGMSVRKLNSETVIKGNSSVELHPSDVCKLAESHRNEDDDDDRGLFITSSEREKCVCNLQRILDRAYQPIVIRELLLLQGSPLRTDKQAKKDNAGTASVSGEKRRAEKLSLLPPQTPQWMRSVCGQLLSERLMKPDGVKAVLHGVLEGSTGSYKL